MLRRIGDEETRRGQYDHLLSLAESSNVTLQVIRPKDGPRAAVSGPFFLFEFAAARPIGYVELLDGAVHLQDLDQVELSPSERTDGPNRSGEQSVHSW